MSCQGHSLVLALNEKGSCTEALLRKMAKPYLPWTQDGTVEEKQTF